MGEPWGEGDWEVSVKKKKEPEPGFPWGWFFVAFVAFLFLVAAFFGGA